MKTKYYQIITFKNEICFFERHRTRETLISNIYEVAFKQIMGIKAS